MAVVFSIPLLLLLLLLLWGEQEPQETRWRPPSN